MDWRVYNAFLLLLCIFPGSRMDRKETSFKLSNVQQYKGFSTSRTFFIYKTNSISGRSCTCSASFSCSCCENVIILYTKARKQLCINFTYQGNDGLNVNITLDSRVIQNRTVTEYKPFKICSPVPGSFFSSVCANILELNEFPRSITACLRTEISTKHKLWELTYNCISISTELPMMSNATVPSGQMPTTSTMRPGQMTTMSTMPSGQMTMMSTMPSGQMTMMSTMPSGQMPGGMPPGSMPPGQMPGGMPPGGMPQMPPGGMPQMPPGGMPQMPPGGMPQMPPGPMSGMPSMTPAIPAL